MKIFFQFIYFTLIISLLCSCIEKQTIEKKSKQPETLNLLTTNSLKFTSGIRSIFQDSKGNYWFGSMKEGVAVFNGISFTYFTTNEGLSNNQIRSIQEDKNGNIWFGTGNGVSSFDGKKMMTHTIIKDTASQNEWKKTSNDLWFNAGDNQGVYRYDDQQVYYLAFPKAKDTKSGNTYLVTNFSKGQNNMLWISTYAGVFGYNGSGFTIITDETLALTLKTGSLHIRSIFEDSKGRLWIGNNGIGVLLQENDTIINFSAKQNLIHPTSSEKEDKSPAGTLEHVFTITEDSQGNIWFGDRDTGIWNYDGSTMKNYTKNDGLINDFPLAIYKDRKDQLWFGMADGNVYKFNGTTFDKQF